MARVLKKVKIAFKVIILRHQVFIDIFVLKEVKKWQTIS